MATGLFLGVFSLLWIVCAGDYPHIPAPEYVPFVGYFISYYRGICGASLVARTVMVTAAVCVVDPSTEKRDNRPLKVILGTTYRHVTRGIKTQVRQVVIPIYPKVKDEVVRNYMIQKSAALLILRWHVPDGMGDMPIRGMGIDVDGEDLLRVSDECVAIGYHYYFAGDKLAKTKFPLQRNLRVQLMLIAKQKQWCRILRVKYDKVMRDIGYDGFHNDHSEICVRDGMYGSPLICKSKITGILTAPDRQWDNCSAFSSIYERIHNKINLRFFNCVKSLFNSEYKVDAHHLKHPLARPDEDLLDYSELYGALPAKDLKDKEDLLVLI